VDRYAGKVGKEIDEIPNALIESLARYHWPGNVRELENCIEHAVLVTKDDVIHGYCLPPTLQLPEDSTLRQAGNLRARVRILERDMIVDALKRSEGNMAAAARTLGITSRMVRYKIKSLGIEYAKLFR
jgi:Nif-specific regulatory protein